MWKDYSASYMKKNRASSISVMAAAFIATLFLSLLCSLFFNFWTYEVEQITLEEGDWQGRITGAIDEEDLSTIQNFANVERAVINEELSGESERTVDIYFQNIRTIFSDMPLIVQQLGLQEDAADYHLLLLSRYLVHDPQDTDPPLLVTFYVVLLLILSFSLILIIRNSFAVSMNARIHQFGILSSVGATPRQIRVCLMQEAAILCLVPIFLGSLIGVALSAGIIQMINRIAAEVSGRHDAIFQYHPLVFLVTIVSSVFTVIFSAWLPARKLSKMTPLEAIYNMNEFQLKKKKVSRILSLLFGMEGELAGNALKAQRKALRTSTLSLTLSFLGFTMMLCFFTLSGISTRHTYYERYQNNWDIMVTVKDTKLEDFRLTEKLEEIPGVEDCVLYQKAMAKGSVSEKWQSEELMALGGVDAVAGSSVSRGKEEWQVKAPIVILEDDAFLRYCKQIGITPSLEGTVILNQIWDSLNSNFRYRKNIPYVKENQKTIILQNTGKDGNTIERMELPILAYTQEVPVLKEEYDNYALVQFLSSSFWTQLSAQIGNVEKDSYIRVMAKDEITLAEVNQIENEIRQILNPVYEIETENRIQDKLTNDNIIAGYKLIIGGFCYLLVLIGIANVFSHTLGFLRQRKREFAQYMSVGLTPNGMRKIFLMEVLVIAGRPFLITLPLTIVFVAFSVTASYLDPMEFVVEAPIIPILVFGAVVFVFVALAYYIGGKQILKCDLSEALRNDAII